MGIFRFCSNAKLVFGGIVEVNSWVLQFRVNSTLESQQICFHFTKLNAKTLNCPLFLYDGNLDCVWRNLIETQINKIGRKRGIHNCNQCSVDPTMSALLKAKKQNKWNPFSINFLCFVCAASSLLMFPFYHVHWHNDYIKHTASSFVPRRFCLFFFFYIRN